MANLSENVTEPVFEQDVIVIYTTTIILYIIVTAVCAPVVLLARWQEATNTGFTEFSMTVVAFAGGLIMLPLNVAFANEPELFRSFTRCSIKCVLQMLLLSLSIEQISVNIVLVNIYQLYPLTAASILTHRRKAIIVWALWLVPCVAYAIASVICYSMLPEAPVTDYCSVSLVPTQIHLLFICAFILPSTLIVIIPGYAFVNKLYEHAKNSNVAHSTEDGPVNEGSTISGRSANKRLSVLLFATVVYFYSFTLASIPLVVSFQILISKKEVSESYEVAWTTASFAIGPMFKVVITLLLRRLRERVKKIIVKVVNWCK